jgi:hypothetical protein
VPTATKPNTREQGTVANQVASNGLKNWGSLINDTEFSPDLRWPANVWVYDKMSKSDAQIKGLMRGTVLPLTRFRYWLDPNGASDTTVQALSRELKLPIKGREDEFSLGRTRNRFTWARHLPIALKALTYGHYFFEQVMEVDEDKYGDDLYHIKKIAPRPPYTIAEINVAKDGELAGIKQTGTSWALGVASPNSPGIPVTALLAYVWEKEGANWTGESMMRSCFRNYVIKDMLMRIDAQKHERMGMGIPWFEAPEGASQDLIDALDELAQEVRAGDEAGLAVPHGAKLKLAGVEGSVPDTPASINMHNEEMARAFLMMFMQLGTTSTGSRALGQQFIEFFNYAQEGIAGWVTETFNEYMIEDWVDWNISEDEAAPRIVYERAPAEGIEPTDLAVLVKEGIIKVDPELESFIRKQKKLPIKTDDQKLKEEEDAKAQEEREHELEKQKAEQQVPPPVPPAPEPEPAKAGSGRRRSKVKAEAEAPSPLSLPDRALRRQPYEHEVSAAVDYARMDQEWEARRDSLFEAVKEMQAAQVDDLHQLIVEADGDLVQLSQISVDDVTHERILASMQEMADEGIDQAATEAEAQGVQNAKRPALSELDDSLTARAQGVGQVLTRELSSAAAQKAMSLSGGSLGPEDVADAVSEHLNGLTKARVRDQLGGAITTAQNSGRKLTMRRNEAEELYASELLDTNTCSECRAEDGKEFDSVDAAEADYPGGGYMGCKGGDRCRGTLVAVYGEEAPSA